jgi:hypothetical protein
MPFVKMARIDVRPEARAEAEAAMHAIATEVRAKLPDAAWTTYRAADHYMVILVAKQPNASLFEDRLQSFAAAPITVDEYQLVTSSDLARRRR